MSETGLSGKRAMRLSGLCIDDDDDDDDDDDTTTMMMMMTKMMMMMIAMLLSFVVDPVQLLQDSFLHRLQ